MIPKTEIAQKISTIFSRKPTTHWSEKEVRQYKRLVKDKVLTGVDQIARIERYYAFQRRRGDKGVHRRDLYTFLNNFAGELDRVREWERQKTTRSVTRRNGDVTHVTPCNAEEFQRISAIARAELERFKRDMR